MAVNRDKPQRWERDIAASVELYNEWYIEFAPRAYGESRVTATRGIAFALEQTAYLTDVNADVLRAHPSVLPMLRMATAPPLARDRLTGLAELPANLVATLEDLNRVPPRMPPKVLTAALDRIGHLIQSLADRDIFPWLNENRLPTEAEAYTAAMIVADRLCGSLANPIIRNAQEQRQLETIRKWLEERDYVHVQGVAFDRMKPGTFSFRVNVVTGTEDGRTTNIPVDAVIMPKTARIGDCPLFIEAKSAGDFANTNKRRKEEAQKFRQLRQTYGDDVRFILFLCGYFGSAYLRYEAAEGIDWVWEHRVDDLEEFGV